MQHWWCGHFLTDPKIRLRCGERVLWSIVEREYSAILLIQELFQRIATGSCSRDQGFITIMKRWTYF